MIIILKVNSILIADSNSGICLSCWFDHFVYSGRTFWVGLIFLWQNSSEPKNLMAEFVEGGSNFPIIIFAELMWADSVAEF
jgi:hypothetical protein